MQWIAASVIKLDKKSSRPNCLEAIVDLIAV